MIDMETRGRGAPEPFPPMPSSRLKSKNPLRRLLDSRYWWLAPLLALLVPAALLFFFLWNTPDFANFQYHFF